MQLRALLGQGEWVSSIDLSDRYLRMPIHQNSKVFMVHTQVPRLNNSPSVLQASNSPTSLHNDNQGSEAYGPQSQKRGSTEHKDYCEPNRVLGLDKEPEKSELIPIRVFSFCGLRVPPRLSPCKTQSRLMGETTGLNPQNKFKVSFDCKMFDVAN